MAPYPDQIYVTIGLLILLILVFIRSMMLKRENRLLSEQLTEISVSLHRSRNDLADLQKKQEQLATFEQDLNTAALTTKLQTPRLTSRNTKQESSAPEKYSFIHSLIEKDLPPTEIASILAISVHEAQQLVNLSKIAKRH